MLKKGELTCGHLTMMLPGLVDLQWSPLLLLLDFGVSFLLYNIGIGQIGAQGGHRFRPNPPNLLKCLVCNCPPQRGSGILASGIVCCVLYWLKCSMLSNIILSDLISHVISHHVHTFHDIISSFLLADGKKAVVHQNMIVFALDFSLCIEVLAGGKNFGVLLWGFCVLIACTSVNGKVLESMGKVLYCGKLSFPVQSWISDCILKSVKPQFPLYRIQWKPIPVFLFPDRQKHSDRKEGHGNGFTVATGLHHDCGKH